MADAYMDINYLVGTAGDPPITVRPDPDVPDDCIQVITVSDSAKQYWGDFQFSVPLEMARLLGQALIKAAGGTNG
jgi:hypothetical protein